MRNHKRMVSLITLTIFVLLTVLSGTALAAKESVGKSAVAKPAMNEGTGNSGFGESEQVTNVGYTGTLRLRQYGGLSVSPGDLGQTNNMSYGYNRNVYDYTVKNYSGTPNNLTVTAKRDSDESDFIGITYNGETRYTVNNQTTITTTFALAAGSNVIEVFVGEFNSVADQNSLNYANSRIGQKYLIRLPWVQPPMESICLQTYSNLVYGINNPPYYEMSSPPPTINNLSHIPGGYWDALIVKVNPANSYQPGYATTIWSMETLDGEGNIIQTGDAWAFISGYWWKAIVFKPIAVGTVKVSVTIEYDSKVFSDDIIITVNDNRSISVDPHNMTLKRKRDPGIITADVAGNEADQSVPERISNSLLIQGDETFIKNTEGNGTSSGYNMNVTWSTNRPDLVDLDTSGDLNEVCEVIPKKSGYATVTATLANGESDSCLVRIRNNQVEIIEEPAPEPAALPEPPAPPALEVLDVTITVGSNLAIVNGGQITLAANTLLIGEDRAMVDYADMAKLIPGLQVAFDWQTQAVTFSKDGKELKMVLNEIPEGFDIPFMDIGGRLVVPVRYVGAFFGATVDWVGDTLIVHMYK